MSIEARNTTGNAVISVLEDLRDEADETVSLTMTTATNAALATSDTVFGLTITDDDATPTVHFAPASDTFVENAGTFTVTAELSAASNLPVTVNFSRAGTRSEERREG